MKPSELFTLRQVIAEQHTLEFWPDLDPETRTHWQAVTRTVRQMPRRDDRAESRARFG